MSIAQDNVVPGCRLNLTKEQLRCYADGLLTADERERIETHLDQCMPCRKQLETILSRGEDAVADTLRKAAEAIPARMRGHYGLHGEKHKPFIVIAEIAAALAVAAAAAAFLTAERKASARMARELDAERQQTVKVAQERDAEREAKAELASELQAERERATNGASHLDLQAAEHLAMPDVRLPSPKEEVRALLVGVDRPGGGKLSSLADRNVEASARYLRRRVGLAESDLKLLSKDPKVAEIREGMKWLAAGARPGGVLVLHLSSFADDKTGELKFVASDGELPLAGLLEEFARVPARMRIAVLDVCYAGRSLGEVAARGQGALFRTEPGSGMVVFASSSAYEQSHNDLLFLQSHFTRFFLEALDGAADSDGDGKLTAGEIHDYVRQRLESVPLREPQTPRLYGDREAVVAEIRNRVGHLIVEGDKLSTASIQIDGKPLGAQPGIRVLERGGEIVCTLPLSQKPYEVSARGAAGQDWHGEALLTAAHPIQRLYVVRQKPGEARITVTRISASQKVILGEVHGLEKEDDYGVACYILSDQLYRHPLFGAELAPICRGRFETEHIRRGYEKALIAAVFRKGSKPPDMVTTVEALDAVAVAVVPYAPQYEAAPAKPPREADAQPARAKPALAVWVEADERTVRGFVTGITPKDLPRYAVRLLAHVDIDYEQPYVGDRHPIAQDGTFETWTRRWVSVRAVLVERATDAEVTSATFRRGDPKPARPQGKNP